MNREPLTLSHCSLLRKRFNALQLNLAEYSFANLYLFRHVHQYELLFADELLIQGKTRAGDSFIMPTSKPSLTVITSFLSLKLENIFLFPIPEEWVSFFQSHLVQMSFKEDDSDYLFLRERFAAFPGRHLDSKRNLVKQLFKAHTVNLIDLMPSEKDQALLILDDWQSNQPLAPEETDYFPCREAIDLSEILHLTLKIVFIDGLPKGLIIGEQLNPTCFVLHFTKADKNIKGLYQYLYQGLAQSLQESCQWINIEQDLGTPSLRQAKQSYHPDKILQKMRIYLK